MIPTVPVYAAEASQAEGIGTSLYEVSTALTAYVNDVVGPNTNDKHNDHKLSEMNRMANAGAFVGYGDDGAGFHAYIASNTAKSVTTSSYDAWMNIGDGGYTYAYVRYGHLLRDLGFDETASHTGGSGVRSVVGVLTQGIYGLSSFVPKIFGFVMDILEMLNPFKLFTDIFDIDTGVDSFEISDGDTSETVDGFEVKATKDVDAGNRAWSKVTHYVGSLYKDLQKIGFAVLPLFLVMLLVSMVLLNSQNKSRKIIVFLERTAFITCGIPLLGFFYTAMLSNVETVTNKEPAATQVVGQTYVDFKTWVTSSRLALPNGVTLTSVGTGSVGGSDATAAGSASSKTVRTARRSVWLLNKKLGIVTGAYAGGYGDYNDTAGMWDDTGKLVSENATKLLKDNINALLSTYQSGDFYQASAFETAVNGSNNDNYPNDLGSTPGTGNAVSNEDKIYGMYGDTNASQFWLDREIDDNKAIFNNGPVTTDLKWVNKPWNIFANGDLQVTGTLNTEENISYKNGTWSGDGIKSGNKGGLSTVAMYNYLSTEFGDSSVQVYSAVKSTSEYVKQSHYAVTLIGSDALRVAYALNVLVVMGVIVVITFVYAIGMIISNIKRMLHMLMSIPAAMLGVLNSIVQVVVYVIMMVVELIATVFVYEFICDLVVMFGSVLESPIEDMVGTSIVGGRFAFVQDLIQASSLYDLRGVFVFGMFVLVFAIAGIGIVIKRFSPSVMSVWEYAWCKMWRLASFEKMQPVFDQWMAERDSLYVWTTVENRIRSFFKSVSDVSKDLVLNDCAGKGVETA